MPLSRTGQAVALVRAELDRPHTPEGDPDAQVGLCRGMPPVGALPQGRQIAARTRFFDGQVLDALRAGVGQVVICGAGYDDRALRFRSEGVRFFELDHPATQTDKVARLHAMWADTTGLTLAPADFSTDDAAGVLERCGHDDGSPTLFICEGLLVYLEESTCTRLLSGLRRRAAPGSTLAVSLAVHSDGMSSEQVVAAANAKRRAARTEPWRTILPVDAHLALLSAAGWDVQVAVDPASFDAGVAFGRTKLVSATPGAGGP